MLVLAFLINAINIALNIGSSSAEMQRSLMKDLIREEISFIGSFLMEWINLVKSGVM